MKIISNCCTCLETSEVICTRCQELGENVDFIILKGE